MKKDDALDPDVLVMTATPIPRTLALTLYGDLDASVIDQLPPGRTPIVTRRTTEERADDVWAFVRKQVAEGRQAYIVYPVVEGAKDDQPELDFAHDEEDAAAAEAKGEASLGVGTKVARKVAAKTAGKAASKTAAKSATKAAAKKSVTKTGAKARGGKAGGSGVISEGEAALGDRDARCFAARRAGGIAAGTAAWAHARGTIRR